MSYPTKLGSGFLAVSLLGLADAAFLAVRHYQSPPAACALLHGCSKVLASPYATVGGIPVALLGVWYYGLLALAALSAVWSGRLELLRPAAWLTAAGLLASAWFVYLQAFVLRAVCLYCMLSAAASLTLFVLGVAVLRMSRPD